jgi:DNA-binding Lrp family transcriptional regulator
MARARYNWKALFLEYNQGRYKSMTEFAEKKNLSYDVVRKRFKELRKESGISKPEPKPDERPHAWQNLKKQFTSWPEEKLQAYLVQIEARLDELKEIPYDELAEEEKRELGKLRRERRCILSDPDPSKKCKAQNKKGEQCQNPVERGKDVCWIHGGAPGNGPPKGNQNGLRHGLYAKIFPDDPEIRDIIDAVGQKSPLGILWDQIVIQYAAIARAQKLMYVKDQEDIKKHLKRVKDGEAFSEREWEFQYPWNRHATFLTAQSKAMGALERLIKRYEEMASGEQQAKVDKLRADIARITGGEDEQPEDDGFLEALKGEIARVWGDDNEET